jgi:lipid-A-disaccharide synthase-like uncharacterized protein
MIDQWREWLYPLGFLATVAFGVRALLQWIDSEAKGKSVVTSFFWRLSISGNLLLLVHTLIQVQFHVCLIQACNVVISWRNLNLMQTPESRTSTSRVFFVLVLTVLGIVLAFLFQEFFLLNGDFVWFRIPVAFWQDPMDRQVSFLWHMVGCLGLVLFNIRFWLQWWYAERYQQSYLGSTFWWISLVGAVLTLSYFLRIEDLANLIGPAFGLIPYVRNLMLIYRAQKSAVPEKSI